MSRDVRWLNIIWKQYKKKSNYARKQVELFLDEEERSLDDERRSKFKTLPPKYKKNFQ